MGARYDFVKVARIYRLRSDMTGDCHEHLHIFLPELLTLDSKFKLHSNSHSEVRD